MPLAKLYANNGKRLNSNGDAELNEDAVDAAVMDQFDRQQDEKDKRKVAQKMVKQQKKLNPGEMFHPRGKAPVNMKVKLDASSDDE